MDTWLTDTLAEASRRTFKNPEGALALLLEAEQRFPNDPTAWLKGARVAWQLQRHPLAVDQYARGLALCDDEALAFEERSLFYLDTVSEDFRNRVRPCFRRQVPTPAPATPEPAQEPAPVQTTPPPTAVLPASTVLAPTPPEPSPTPLVVAPAGAAAEAELEGAAPSPPPASAPQEPVATPRVASTEPVPAAPTRASVLIPATVVAGPASAFVGPPVTQLSAGSRVADRYVVESGVAGRGGYAVVYRARDERLGRAVAVKVVDTARLAGAAGDAAQALAARIQAALQAFAAVEHPNLARIYDVGLLEGGQAAFVVTEWLEGVRLDRAITVPIPAEQTLAVMRDLAAGASALHQRGLVHAAIRPDHVIILAPATVQQRAVLVDLAVAPTLTGPERQRIAAGAANRYASPEALTGRAPMSTASDVFQLGLVWAELLSGAPVMPAHTSVLAGTPTPELPPSVVSGPMGPAILRALDPDPANRFADAAQLRMALGEPSGRGAGVEATPPPVAAAPPVAPARSGPPPIDVPRLQQRIFQQDEGYVLVSAGTFVMGSPLDEVGRGGDETLHDVFVASPFLMQETPFTVAQWLELMSELPAALSDIIKREQLNKPLPLEPIRCVSWFDAVACLNALSRREGLPEFYALDGRDPRPLGGPGYRLPTEAEWEYAARAGLASTLGRYGKANAIAWFNNWSMFKSRSAFESRQKTPNGWGLHDMLGNVREWTGDWYGPYPGTRAVSPTGPGLGSSRVTRGGGWRSEVRLVRFASREPLDPFGVHDDVGFRPVRTFGWGLDAETSARALWLARERP